jgi:L-fuconolactonase
LSETIELVDTHVHLIGDPKRYPLHPTALPGDSWYREAPTDATTFAGLMQEAGVGRAVLVQPVGAYGFDNSYALDVAREFPESFAAVAAIDVAAPDPVADIAEAAAAGAGGLRFFAVRDPDPFALNSEAYRPLWQAAARARLPVVATVMFEQLAGLGRVLARHCEVPVVLDHCAFPNLADLPDFQQSQALFELAGHSQLSLKVTNHLLGHTTIATGQAFLSALVAAFGAGRIMWGSDFAQTHDRPYAELAAAARRAAHGLQPRERADVLGRTAAKFWWRA